METDKSKNEGEKGQVPEKSAKRRKKSRAFEKFEAANDEPQGTAVLAAVKQEHPEFSRSSSEDGDEAASREGNQQAAQSRAEAERRVRAELQARLKEEEKTLAPPAKVPVVVPARIHVPAFATSAGLGQNAALLALPTRRAEGERKARLELQEKLKAESKTLLEERAKAEKAKAAEVAKSKAKAEAKEAKEAKEAAKEAAKEVAKEANKEPKEPKASTSKVEEAKAKAKSKVDAKAAKTKEAKAAEAKNKVAPKAAAGVRKSQAAHPPEDGQLVPVKQEHGRSRSSSADGQSKGKKPTKASAAKAKASPNAPAGGHLFGAAAMKPKAQEKSSGADSMVLVEIVFKEKILKVNHKASTKIQELFNLYEPRIRGKCKDLGALRVCDDKGVEQGSELTLSVLRESGVSGAAGTTGASNPAVRLVFQEDDWLS